MSKFSSAALGASFRAFAGAAAAAVLATATPALAADYYVSDASALPGLDMDNGQGYGAYSPNMPFEAIYMTPYLVTANLGTTFDANASATFLAFCLDPFTSLRPASDFDGGDPAYKSFSGGNALVGRLINFGTTLYQSNPTDFAHLTAVQGAIWQVLFPDYTFTAYSGNIDAATVNSLISAYSAGTGVPTTPASYATFLSNDRGSQALGVAVRAAVPEPGTWMVMIVGFFALGYRLRRPVRSSSASV